MHPSSSQGVDETQLASILASSQLAKGIQASLQDEGYSAQVAPAVTVTAVTTPSAAPTLSPVAINCNSFTQQKSRPVEWLAYCAPTHSPTPAPAIVVTQTFEGKVSAKEAESKDFAKAVGQAVAIALGLNQDDVTVSEVSLEKHGDGVEVTYSISDKYDLTAKEVDQTLSDDGTALAMDQVRRVGSRYTLAIPLVYYYIHYYSHRYVELLLTFDCSVTVYRC